MKNLNAGGKINNRTTINSTELTLETTYKVTCFRRVSTRYGPRIIADIEDDLSYFLPESYGKRFMLGYGTEATNLDNFNCYAITMEFMGLTKGTYITPILKFRYNSSRVETKFDVKPYTSYDDKGYLENMYMLIYHLKMAYFDGGDAMTYGREFYSSTEIALARQRNFMIILKLQPYWVVLTTFWIVMFI